MAILLRILDGPHAGAQCEVLPGQRVVLGRGQESGLSVLDHWVSRSHCAIAETPQGVFLEDLGSKNGTYVAGQRVERCKLHPGAMVQLGTTTVEVLLRPTAEVAMLAGAAPAPSGLGLRHAGALALLLLLVVGGVYGGFRLLGGRTAGPAPAAQAPTEAAAAKKPRLGAADGTPVTFTSDPSGAMVFLDDEFRDVTPLANYPVAPGTHALRIQKAGYLVHRSTLTVDKRPGEPVHVVLRLAERGSLHLTSAPDGADVYLDGELRGRTPLTVPNLEPRVHALHLLKQNFTDWEQDVTVKANETVTVQATLGHREIGYYLAKLKEDPNNVSYYTELAHLYLLEKNVEACMQNLAKALDISLYGQDSSRPEPYHARLVWLISKIYFEDHFDYGDAAFVARVRSAIDDMLADVAVRHSDRDALLQLARKLYQRAGMPEKMAALTLKIAEGRPGDDESFPTAVAHLLREGQAERAEKLIQQALEKTPKDYRAHLLLGRVHLAAKRHGVAGSREKAVQALNAALEQCTDEKAKDDIRRLLGKATQ